jgi:hypothetical protein
MLFNQKSKIPSVKCTKIQTRKIKAMTLLLFNDRLEWTLAEVEEQLHIGAFKSFENF